MDNSLEDMKTQLLAMCPLAVESMRPFNDEYNTYLLKRVFVLEQALLAARDEIFHLRGLPKKEEN